MPFIAVHKETGERVNILDTPIEYIRSFPVGALVCQLCESPMFPKSSHTRLGIPVRAHFVHSRRECSSSHPGYEGGAGESVYHLKGKQYLVEAWIPGYRRYADALVEYEQHIKEDDADQIADVLVTLPNGHRIAHEVQLAPITTEQLQERTNGYISASIDVYWHLGFSADTPANRDYLAGIGCDFSQIVFRREDAEPDRRAA